MKEEYKILQDKGIIPKEIPDSLLFNKKGKQYWEELL